jgi:hypothetical protein
MEKWLANIYRKSPNQVYVIGISHRDTLTGSNGRLTSRVQAEVYKIGEWLIRNRGRELLLPEGFFAEGTTKTGEKRKESRSPAVSPPEPNLESLEKRFSEGGTYINAEMLLNQNFPLLLRQVEDKELYQSVYQKVRLLAQSGGNLERRFLIRSELGYLQKKRVGIMLQKISEIVKREFREGHIDAKKALFTIGPNRISDIITHLKERKITVLSPLFTAIKYQNYIDALHLTQENFGISVILPRTLTNDHQAKSISKLNVF